MLPINPVIYVQTMTKKTVKGTWGGKRERKNKKPESVVIRVPLVAKEAVKKFVLELDNSLCKCGGKLEYSIFSAKISWCPKCNKHDYEI